MASIVYPQYVWVDTGGIMNLTADKCIVLKGKKVALIPNLGATEICKQKALKIPALKGCTVWMGLEEKAM